MMYVNCRLAVSVTVESHPLAAGFNTLCPTALRAHPQIRGLEVVEGKTDRAHPLGCMTLLFGNYANNSLSLWLA